MYELGVKAPYNEKYLILCQSREDPGCPPPGTVLPIRMWQTLCCRRRNFASIAPIAWDLTFFCCSWPHLSISAPGALVSYLPPSFVTDCLYTASRWLVVIMNSPLGMGRCRLQKCFLNIPDNIFSYHQKEKRNPYLCCVDLQGFSPGLG